MMASLKNTKKIASDLEVARQVLAKEADAIRDLAKIIDTSFVDALNIMDKTKGRIIVSGMGKSGLIAKKIAATLASTGTPAQYVNAAETSHGDLGMITKDDVVFALSNSGETHELSDLVAHTKLNEIPLITLTGQQGSSLNKAGDVSLLLPKIVEACPLNLAPTTSTTAMLALGDALAVALLERKGFSKEKFNALHPGGQLGKRFIKISDIMNSGDAIPLVKCKTSMSETLLIMTQKSFGCVGIIGTKGQLLGIITDGDLRRNMGHNLFESAAEDIMTRAPKTMGPDVLAPVALHLMEKRKITALFVLEEKIPIGIIHIHDLLRAGIV